PTAAELKTVLAAIQTRHQDSGIELIEVASGYRLQVKAELSPWLSKLWEGRTPRYSRAFLETLAIIAYKQPITRAEIEEIRGVTVNSHIIKTLLDREWIRVIGHRDLPGKPAILGTTKSFLDYFNLKSLMELPSLAEFKNFEAQEAQLEAQLQIPLALEHHEETSPEENNIIAENAVISEEETVTETQ
ncbi:MAG TPA: SMC-Scp complex subunit ScpB, partial [Gammaproteobacteria bacterium]|nr:SMC-Scp complex subunit ScpB [Gammaproteobacteria bacterium]